MSKFLQFLDLFTPPPIRIQLALLIISLPLLGMTQLRLSCCGFGPGEAFLILWLVFLFFELIKNRTLFFDNNLTKVFIGFWLFSLTIMAIGAYFGHSLMASGMGDPENVGAWEYDEPLSKWLFYGPIHDAIAYSGLMVITVLLAGYKYSWKELHTAFIAVAVISTVVMYALLLFKLFGISVEPFKLEGSNNSRFQGLANNPNQAALLIIFVPFFITAFIENNIDRISRKQKVGLALILAMAFIVGIETRSTAYRISFILWFGIMFLLWLKLVMRKNNLLNPVIKIVALAVVFAFILNSIHQPIREATEIERAQKISKLPLQLKNPPDRNPPWISEDNPQIPEDNSKIPEDNSKIPEKTSSIPLDKILDIGLKEQKGATTFQAGDADTLYFSHLPQFNFPGDFTIECWFFTPLRYGDHRLFSHWGFGGYIGGLSDYSIYAMSKGQLGINIGHVKAPAPAPSIWHHYAYTREGPVYRLFIDGIQVDSVTEETVENLSLKTPLLIGAQNKNKYHWVGLINDTQIYPGKALYTSNFTPIKKISSKDALDVSEKAFIKIITKDGPVKLISGKRPKPNFFSKVINFSFTSIKYNFKHLAGTILKKSEYRLPMYFNGFKALSYSPIVGLGPGPYSGATGPFHRKEIHNSFFDWMLNTGILGGIAIIALFIWTAKRLWSKHCYSLFCGLVTMALFAQFHHVIRHPIVWIFLILSLKIADRKDMIAHINPNSQ